jgi:adenylate cyclase
MMVQRKLTTILAADAEGYSRVMAADEEGAFDSLHVSRRVFFGAIERHGGRVVNTAGDGLIAEFPSVVEAVRCAIEVQRELGSLGAAREGGLRFRIGVHLGDVMIDGDDLLGEGVNLAARLQTMAEPGGILISQQVYDQVGGKLSVEFEYLGQQRPKNFPEDVAVYRIAGAGRRDKRGRRRRQSPHPSPEPSAPPEGLRARVVRHAIWLAALWGLLLVVDLVTGEPFWAHWPGLAMAALVGLEVPPLFLRGRYWVLYARGIVILVTLAVINLVTWHGYPWVLWCVAGFAAAEFLRRLFVRSR